MANVEHNTRDNASLHPFARRSESDPGAIGAGRGWFKLSTGELKVRNAADDGWVLAGGSTSSAASETVAGIAEIATTSETNTGTDDARIVTPLKLAGRTSTETRAGVIEIATQVETDAGTDDARAVTPAKLANYSGLGGGGGWTAVDASETVKGIAELATQSETNTGTDDTRIVTPLKLKTNVDLHINDTTDAHDASAISIADSANQYTATNAEDALAEVLDALQAHEADTTDAHDASAISFSPTGTIAATDVQTAIAEVASEASAGYRTLVELSTDRTNTTGSLADVTGLSFPVTSGVTYRFEAFVDFDVDATTTGTAFAVNGPTLTRLAMSSHIPSSNAAFVDRTFNGYDGTGGGATIHTPSSPFTSGNLAYLRGTIVCSASGTVVVRFRPEAAAQSVTVKAKSTIEYW